MPVTIDSSNIIIDRGASNVYVDIVKTKGYIKKNNVAICIPELEEEYSYNDSIYNYNIFTYNKDIYPSLNIDNSNLIVHWKFDNHNLFHNYSMNPASINVNQRNISNIYSNGVIDLNNKYIGVGSLFKSDQNDIYGYNITPANWMSELLEKEATFTFWIKQTYSYSTNIVQTIFSHDSTFAIKQENGNFRVYIATGNYSYYDNVASFLFTYNTWVHIAIVINLNANTNINNVINIYRNGELLNSTLNTYVNTYSGIIGSGFPNNNNIFRFLSGSETNLNSGFKGNIDDFRIYNKCLSGTEIYDLYNNYKSTKYNIKFENDTYCDMLIVAGGGGGSRRMGGGGGAGALIFDNFTFRKNKEYILKIGKGGLGVDTPGNIGGEITTSIKTGENGGDSEIINEDICIYRAAGGGGGQGGGTLSGQNAASGGSGGGSGGKDYLHGGLLSNNNIVNGNSISVYRNYYDSGDAPKYNSSKVFGNEGGIGNGDNPRGGGGGGGAGSRGFDSFDQNPNNNNIIKGGDGIHSVDNIDFKSFFSIKNTNIGHHYSDKVYFSGGGGGGNWDGSIYYNDGGLGGGGRSGMSSTLRLPNINGMLNTGGGGGGEGKDEYGGGHGGSGVIILKYKLNKIDSSQEYDAQWKYKRNTSNVYFMGNVGIGTKSNPEYSLNVQGDINITGDLYKNGALIEYPKYLVKTDDVEISPILDLSLYKDSIDENFTSTPSILYKYHILTYEGSSGYTSTTDGNQRTYNIDFPEDAVADILVVGGGGGGGGSIGGGGGGGSVIYATGIDVPANTYTIKVGKGGSGGINSTDGTNGYNSEAFGAIALGGGRGGDYNISGSRASGGSGGGTGGGMYNSQGLGIALAGNKTISSSSLLYTNYSYYANDGGDALWQDGNHFRNETTGGGGGGAGTKGSSFNGFSYGGSAVNNDFIGLGGDGVPINITGVSVYYGAGGGGGSHKGGLSEWLGKPGGLGGGGNGGNEFSTGIRTDGTNGTGYGAGGGGGAFRKNGGNGGSGVVIIRYYVASSITHKYLAFQQDYITSVQLKAEQITGVIGWKLVRYKPVSNLWFSGNNNLQGTYLLNHTTKLPTQEWAITWNDATENEVLFVKGDFVSWLRCNASSLDVWGWTNPTALGGNKLTDGKFTMYRDEKSWKTSPYIFDHSVVYTDAYGDMIYSEYSEVGYSNVPGATWPNPDIPDYYGTENYEYYVLVRNSGATSSIPSNTYQLNFPLNTTCDILVRNNSQYSHTAGVTLNGSYNVEVGSDSKIQKNGIDLYVPNTNLSKTDNNSIVIIKYYMNKNEITEITCDAGENKITTIEPVFNNNFGDLFNELYIKIDEATSFETNKYNIQRKFSGDDTDFSTTIDAKTKKYYIFSNIIYCKKNTSYTISLNSIYSLLKSTGKGWDILDNTNGVYIEKLNKIFLMKKFHFYETCLKGIQDDNTNITDNVTNNCNGAIINNTTNENKVYAMRCDIVILNDNNMQIQANLNVNIVEQPLQSQTTTQLQSTTQSQSTSSEPFSLYEGFNLQDLNYNFRSDITPKSIDNYYKKTYTTLKGNYDSYVDALNGSDYYIIEDDCDLLNNTECDNISNLRIKKDSFITSINNKINSETDWNNIPTATLKSNVNLNNNDSNVFDFKNINEYITEEQQKNIAKRVPTFTPGGYSIYFQIDNS